MDRELGMLLWFVSVFIAIGFIILGGLFKVYESNQEARWEAQFQYFYQRYLEETSEVK